MKLWIAVKYSPLSLYRDRITHINKLRLDNRWFLPKQFDSPYPIHIEILITHPCTRSGTKTRCAVCDTIPKEYSTDQYDTKHFITYTVDQLRGCVYRSSKRHIIPPIVQPENGEGWTYWKIPDASPAGIEKAMLFLEQQIGKPFISRSWNFWCLCRSRGVHQGQDFGEAEGWYCSELAAASLLLCSDEFKQNCTKDPCLVTPCVLTSLVCDLASAEAVDKIPNFSAVRR